MSENKDTSTQQTKTDSPKKSEGRWYSSYLLAIAMVIGVGLWFMSGEVVVGGQGGGDSKNTPSTVRQTSTNTTKDQDKLETEANNTTSGKTAPGKSASGNKDDQKPFRVAIRTFKPEPREAELVLRGRTEANKRVQISSETAGVVAKTAVEKGDFVKTGQLLCQIEDGVRRARLSEGKARVAQEQTQYNASKKLAQRGYASRIKLIEGQAQLDAAKATLKQIELELENTRILAPFEGIVEDLVSKAGSYLNVGQPCATLVSLSPLRAVGAISERDVAKVKVGMTADAVLVTGETARGKIKFISPSSDTGTRTFRIEVEIANEKRLLRDGVTTDIKIPLPVETAHKLPTSILALADNGDIGVRVVDPGDAVRFRKVKILSQQRDGVWVKGLNGPTRVITVGQEFVGEGQKVDPVQQPSSTIIKSRNGQGKPATQ